jgi:hypothetical protein
LRPVEHDGRVEQHCPIPAGGQLTGWHPSPSSPLIPTQFWKPAKLLMLYGFASVHTSVTSLFGWLIVTLQPGTLVCDAVPPGHCDVLNAPPPLLFVVNVKSTVPQHTPLPTQLPPEHESEPLQD